MCLERKRVGEKESEREIEEGGGVECERQYGKNDHHRTEEKYKNKPNEYIYSLKQIHTYIYTYLQIHSHIHSFNHRKRNSVNIHYSVPNSAKHFMVKCIRCTINLMLMCNCNFKPLSDINYLTFLPWYSMKNATLNRSFSTNQHTEKTLRARQRSEKETNHG